MGVRRRVMAVAAAVTVAAFAAMPGATASPYNETCGDGTPHGCVQHCLRYHGGWANLENCLYAHYLV